MAEPIISRAAIRAKGAAHYHADGTRDSHGFNPGSSAIADFHIGWDTAASTQFGIAAVTRVENAQEHR